MENKKRYSLIKIFWVLLCVYLFFAVLSFIILSIVPDPEHNYVKKMMNWQYAASQIASLIFSTFYYYFAVNTFYRYIVDKRSVVYFFKPAALALLATAAFYVFNFFVFNPQKVVIAINADKGKPLPLGLLVFSYAFSALFFLGIALLASYLTYLRDEKKRQKVLEEQKMQLEVEKSQANFNFLKAQINPHFLHNTLNFLYAKALPLSPELSEGILTLSDIMRYALSEGNAKDGKALLKDEIEHVRNVVKIQQLRFNNRLNVKLDVEGVVNGATIIPFVLITLVENAFKHGDLKSDEQPIEIKIKMGSQGGLYFYCRNKKKIGPKELSTGIGLDNIKKRLDLAYPNNYIFNVRDEDDFYTTELIIHSL